MGERDWLPATRALAYASAHDCDISAERFEVVENGKLWRGFVGTVYATMVGTENGYKFDTFDGARKNAEQFVLNCREIVADTNKQKRGAHD